MNLTLSLLMIDALAAGVGSDDAIQKALVRLPGCLLLAHRVDFGMPA